MMKLLKTVLGVTVLLIALSPGLGLAQRAGFDKLKASVKLNKLRIADTQIRKVAFLAAIAVDRCDPPAARRGIKDLKRIQSQILSRINSGKPVGEAAKRDLAMLKIRSAWALLEQHLRQHCGSRLVSDKTLRHSYGFFVKDTREYAQKQLNAAVAAAKACDKAAYRRAVVNIKWAANRSRKASRRNAQFRDKYAGDAVALEMLEFDFRLRQRVFFKHCTKEKPQTVARRFFWVRTRPDADWGGRDTDCTEGATPNDRLCKSAKLGTVAVCWKGRSTGQPRAKCNSFSTWCTYKSVKVNTVPDGTAKGAVYVCRQSRK